MSYIMNRIKILLILMVLSFVACKNKESYIIDKKVIDLEHSLSVSDKEMPLSVKKVIPLEFTDASVLGQNISIIDVSSQYIIVKMLI